VDQELLLRNGYLAAENRILRGQLKGRLTLSDGERATLGEIGQRLGRKALGEVATAAAGHHLRVVPKACRSQIRRVAWASRPWQAANRQRRRGPDRSHGQGEPVLGLRPDRRSSGQSGPRGFRSNGRQCSTSPWYAAGAEAQARDHVGRIHSSSP
jgi:putative transposase